MVGCEIGFILRAYDEKKRDERELVFTTDSVNGYPLPFSRGGLALFNEWSVSSRRLHEPCKAPP